MDIQGKDKYTDKNLKEQFQSFKAAKAHFRIKARSWKALAAKLNKPTPEQEIAMLKEQVKRLEAEVARLREAGEDAFDEVGFWLLDRNFERAIFEDFGVSEQATEMESEAKKIHKELSQRYHPDSGGSDEQMANVNKLKKQMLSVVRLNGGMGL